MLPISLRVTAESWPLAKTFTISRGSKTEARVVVAELGDGEHTGRGECVPYPRYGETVEGVAAAIEGMRGALENGLDRSCLQKAMPAGAARNALDCAFWDLEAKRSGRPVYELAGLVAPRPLVTLHTIPLDTPEKMAEAAREAAAHTMRIKVKLGADGDLDRLKAIREAVPDTMIIVDANEGWTPENIEANLYACKQYQVLLVEQPLPAVNDAKLKGLPRLIPIYADESVHDRKSLPALKGKYDAVNIKLDKTGGLTEALAMAAAAKSMGFDIMVGCMVSTSLAIAPALLVAQKARIVDLDGPLLLARDRPDALRYTQGRVGLSDPALWG
ncbi:MAG: L-Ala-D/L-Glu epimerase [Alphaproteobacteria bacterium]|nr:L-Ala-D/L-Glu epimerase [Alphaproteobacteria bacterium]